MCDPISIGGAALSGLGTLMNMQAQSNYVKRQNAANEDAAAFSRTRWEAEKARQDEMSRAARKTVDVETDRNTLDQQQAIIDQERSRRETSYGSAVPALADPNRIALLPTQGTDSVVKDQAAKDLADYLGRARGQIAAKARLESFGGLDQQNNLATAIANSTLNQNAGFRRASMALNQRETSIPAAQVGAPDTTLGTVLSTLGGMGMYAGAAGWNPFAGGAGGSALSGGGAAVSGPGVVTMPNGGSARAPMFVY